MRFLLLLPLLLSTFLVGAQSLTVRGVVRARPDHAALPGVTILEKGTANGTVTNAQGRFMLTTSRPAPQLVISAIGYLTQEVAVTHPADSLVVLLQADNKALSEVVVVGYATVRKHDVTGAVSTLSGAVPGVMIRGASSVSAAPRSPVRRSAIPRTSSSPAADQAPITPPEPRAKAGTLTAGELNDFGKWNLWSNIAQQDLNEWRQRWHLSPLERYAVQVVTADGFPVVGASVRLLDQRDSLLWQAPSDNTGKCELWNRLFTNAAKQQAATLQAVVAGKTYVVHHPTVFHDGLNIIQVSPPCQAAPTGVDVAFVVDATGSMGDEIRYLQAELGDVIAQVKDSLAAATLHLGSVFYRDAGDAYVTRTTPLSPNIAQTLDFIGQQAADGGGDTPEAVDQALDVALHRLAWRAQAKARLLFLILDAPPHEDSQVLASLQRSIRQAAARGIRLIPITASGIDKSTEYLMRSMALATNGTYVFLTDDSGVGEAHLKPTTDQFTVERLNTLLVRLITKYASTTDCQLPQANRSAKVDTLIGHYAPPADTVVGTSKRSRHVNDYTWQCYPNPTADLLHVELAGDIKELFVTDVTGKLLLRAVPTHRQATVQVGSLPTGIYFLRFFTGQQWEQAKFLVSR